MISIKRGNNFKVEILANYDLTQIDKVVFIFKEFEDEEANALLVKTFINGENNSDIIYENGKFIISLSQLDSYKLPDGIIYVDSHPYLLNGEILETDIKKIRIKKTLFKIDETQLVKDDIAERLREQLANILHDITGEDYSSYSYEELLDVVKNLDSGAQQKLYNSLLEIKTQYNLETIIDNTNVETLIVSMEDMFEELYNYFDTLLSGMETLLSPVEFGFCGDQAIWTYYSDGTLRINGEGIMKYIGWTEEDFFKDISKCIIENGITNIQDDSFYYSNLISIIIPDSITKIGSFAFRSCMNIISFTIPDNVSEIGEYAFALCRNLNNIVLGKGLTTITNRAFMGCSKITNIEIPENIKVIEELAFYECSHLENVYIKDVVTQIASDAFENCSTDIYVPWSEGEIPGAPWGTTGTIYYNYQGG